MSRAKINDHEACVLCGELHHPQQLCPCPRCYQVHDRTYCSNSCALCNRLHEGSCGGHYSNRCLLCGDPHQPWVRCPCPRCFLRHAGDYCPNEEEWSLHPFNAFWTRLIADRCTSCGQQHSMETGCPCAVCHQWPIKWRPDPPGCIVSYAPGCTRDLMSATNQPTICGKLLIG